MWEEAYENHLFKLTDLGEFRFFLRLLSTRKSNQSFLILSKYCSRLQKVFGMELAEPALTILITNNNSFLGAADSKV